MEYVWIAIGSALGGAGRFYLSGVIARRFGESFPMGTLAVNVAGCFLIGLIFTLTSPSGRLLAHPHARQAVMVGVLGGFTTFSSFSLQTLNLVRDGEWLLAGLNVILSVVLCLAAVVLGHFLAGGLNR